MQNESLKSEQAYTAESIKTLRGLDAVRKRPAMYVGSTDISGLHHLVYEVVDNSIDEALAGYCKRIDVSVHQDNSVSVLDDGRGIPVDYHAEEKMSAVQLVLTTLHSGGKFDNISYKISGGLHGVGVSCVNALAIWLKVEVYRNGQIYFIEFNRGTPLADVRITGAIDKRGTKVTFKPDPEIFETTEFSFDILSKRLRELAFLNKGIVISINDQRDIHGWIIFHILVYHGEIEQSPTVIIIDRSPRHPELAQDSRGVYLGRGFTVGIGRVGMGRVLDADAEP